MYKKAKLRDLQVAEAGGGCVFDDVFFLMKKNMKHPNVPNELSDFFVWEVAGLRLVELIGRWL